MSPSANSATFSLASKVAVVTGANRGIGRALAIGLAQAGADIVAVGRSLPADVEQELKSQGRQFLFLEADLSSGKPAEGLLQAATGLNGRVDILINNAGTIRRAPALGFTELDWDDVINVNLKSAFFLSQQAARLMVADGGGGKIINIASLLSFQGGITVPSYTASKHGIAGLTRALANEWATKGINVNAIAPGYFVTDNTENLRKDTKRYGEILSRIPAERWGEPEDLVGAAVFLASNAANYVHGAIIPVDGGWLAR